MNAQELIKYKELLDDKAITQEEFDNKKREFLNAKIGKSKTNIVSVIGLITSCIIPVVGLILSIIGLVQCNRKNEEGKVFALAGIIVSSVLTIFWTIVVLF